MPKTSVTVYYHDHCSDGFTAAWAANLKFRNDPTVDLSLIPYSIGDPLPSLPESGRVYIADLSFTPEFFEALRAKLGTTNVKMLDHHKSAQETFRPYAGDPGVVFDMNKSGARLAWEEFFPEADVPNIVSYVEDRDLWRFDLPYSRDVSTAILSYPLEMGAWNTLAERLGYKPLTKEHPLVVEGHAISRYKDSLVASAISRTGEIGLLPTGARALFVNSSVLASDIGNTKADVPVVVVWTRQKDGRYYYSLRGGETAPDLSRLAKQFGGGGHAKAAGFTADHFIFTPLVKDAGERDTDKSHER